MNPSRFIVLLLAFCLLAILALGWYLRQPKEPPPPPVTPTPTVAAKATETPSPDTSARVEHRLAGTVVGDEQYVVIEHPDGRNELYRPGQTVPGLGKLGDIGPDSAAFDADGRQITLRLLPAPTPTAATPAPAAAEAEATATTRPEEPARPARSGNGSSP
jgi:hypothetical protein